ncbi:MAG: hypothetical protein NUW02_03070 [Candidatus Campbellbacteria bacterium]|nr:hypothetical protein [Candidatus Campbellbacteria bacterium]
MKFGSPEASQPNRQEISFSVHTELIKNAHEKALALIEREAVNPTDHGAVYSSEKIKLEQQEAGEAKKKFNHDDPLMEQASLAAEAFLYEQIGRHGWISTPDIHVYPEKTADIDDIFNKTDIVLTFETGDGEKTLAVTVDVTIGTKTLKEKIHSIKQEIDKQSLTTVKYHETPSGKQGPLEKTPRVVLSLEANTLIELLSLWTSSDTDSRERLKKHPIQLDMVQEIEVQLEAYEKYAQETGKKELADRFKQALGVIHTIREEKERQIGKGENRKETRALHDMRIALGSQLSNPSSQKVLRESRAEQGRRTDILKRLRY